ncbi:hypothetical protein ACFPZI_33035, partial [Streptomyces chlorus]
NSQNPRSESQSEISTEPGAVQFDISKRAVWEAYEGVKANKGAAGVDGRSIEEFESAVSDVSCRFTPM